MKLLISFLSILSLGSAVNHHHPLRLSDAQREKIQQNRMLEQHANGDRDLNNDGICNSTMYAMIDSDELFDLLEGTICTDGKDENLSCTYDFGNTTAAPAALAQYVEICDNNFDGHVQTVHVIDTCFDIYYSESNYENLDGELYETPDGDFYNLYDFIQPICVPGVCTDEEAIESMYHFLSEQVELEECVPDDISFVVQDDKTTTESPTTAPNTPSPTAKNTTSGARGVSCTLVLALISTVLAFFDAIG